VPRLPRSLTSADQRHVAERQLRCAPELAERDALDQREDVALEGREVDELAVLFVPLLGLARRLADSCQRRSSTKAATASLNRKGPFPGPCRARSDGSPGRYPGEVAVRLGRVERAEVGELVEGGAEESRERESAAGRVVQYVTDEGVGCEGFGEQASGVNQAIGSPSPAARW